MTLTSATRGLTTAGYVLFTAAVPTPSKPSPDAATPPEPRPRLRSFEVENFRLFRRERLDVHPDVTVLAGVNDVGKSTLLEAMGLYGASQRSLRRVLRDDDFRGTGEDATRFTAEWEVRGQILRHTLLLAADTPEERLESPDGHWIWRPRDRTLETEEGALRVKGVPRLAALAQIADATWRIENDIKPHVYQPVAVTRGFTMPLAYLFEPYALTRPAPVALETPRRNGVGWAAWLQAIINRRDDEIGMLEGELRALFPHFAAVRVHVEHRAELGEHTADVDEAGAHRERRGVAEGPRLTVEIEIAPDARAPSGPPLRVPAAKASSGLLLALCHFALVHATPEGGLLLLEEPENGLNARVTRAMMRSFLAAVQRRGQQVVLSTHNAWWLDIVPPEAIRVLTRDEGGAHIHVPPKERIQALLGDDDLYPSEVVGTYGPEGLLYLDKNRR